MNENCVPGGGNDGYPRLAFDCVLNDWFGSECGLDVPDEWPSERLVQLSPDDPLPFNSIVVAYGVGLSGDYKMSNKLIIMIHQMTNLKELENGWLDRKVFYTLRQL